MKWSATICMEECLETIHSPVPEETLSPEEPEELNVNLGRRTLTIEGKLEIKGNDSYSMRSFTPKLELHEDVDLEQIRSTITEDDHFAVEASEMANLDVSGRDISIRRSTTEN
ncbi:hypothetical protein ANCCAN_26738 [Ancylostoma caninum]|uniref:SHSP domain-containing protein n=1 Tax=Ancylostoma caninum TaxID=29170 RepID=A0A368FBH5_ANCCA|nr:hypothetical protein ANCCAN_26738 [Ancylostoma caninum]